MNSLKKRENTQTLEESLQFLCSHGNPRVSKMDSGWYAKIEMFISSQGTRFYIASDFTHSTPSEAVNVLISRLKDTLDKLT